LVLHFILKQLTKKRDLNHKLFFQRNTNTPTSMKSEVRLPARTTVVIC